MRLWTEIGFSSIYFLLKKLEKEGLIEGQLQEAEQGPVRKVYQPTPEGWQALSAGIIEVLSVPHPHYRPLHLGIRNLTLIQPSEALTALRNYCHNLIARQEHLQSLRESRQPLPLRVDAMFDYSLALIKAELAWVTQFIGRLQTQLEVEQ